MSSGLQAEEFHSTVHILLEWLAEAEQSLRFHGSLPDDEEALQALIEQHEASNANIYAFFILSNFKFIFKVLILTFLVALINK